MSTTAPPAPTETGGRVGLVQASALYIAAVLGMGILALPGLAAEAAGPASIVAVLAVLGLSIPLAGTFAALAARYPDAGEWRRSCVSRSDMTQAETESSARARVAQRYICRVGRN